MTSVISKARSIAQRVLFLAVSLAFASCDGQSHQLVRESVQHLGGESSMEARGNFTTRSTTTGVRQVDGILIVTQDITFTVTGDLSGTASAQDTVVINPSTGTGFFFGTGTLTGTVLGRSGTVGFMFTGTFTGYPALPRLRGHVVFFPESGTGQLRRLGGEGTLQGILDVGGTYSIEVEFGS